MRIAIYPREGTETDPASVGVARKILQFIPARGRKRPKLFVKLNSFAKIAIYPREGTETPGLDTPG